MKLKPIKALIGLEHERVIFKDGKVYSVRRRNQEEFPHDTMAVLAETRGSPSSECMGILTNFLNEQARVDSLYALAGLRLEHGEFKIPKGLACKSLEHVGDDKKDDDLSDISCSDSHIYRGGGLHIHYSMHVEDHDRTFRNIDMLTNDWFFRHLIIDKLDQATQFIVGASRYRRPYQWRPKPYGFEYRSYFWRGDLETLTSITNTAVWAAEYALRCAKSLVGAIDRGGITA